MPDVCHSTSILILWYKCGHGQGNNLQKLGKLAQPLKWHPLSYCSYRVSTLLGFHCIAIIATLDGPVQIAQLPLV